MLIGAYDPETLYSNYCMDAAFYYEHGYHRVFPQFEPMLRDAGKDARAMATFAGPERREAVDIGLGYIRAKVQLEEKYKASLANLSARLNRREEGMYQDVRVTLAKTYALGLVDDLAFVIAHASQHAWQVNRLYEAAMFGSFLDDGALSGKLDRTDYDWCLVEVGQAMAGKAGNCALG